MKKLTINLEYCYGIKKLNYKFDFSKSNTYSIYAPNGIMKTSFAKTFKDLSNEKEPADLMFPARKTISTVLDETNTPISPKQIFVIEPYNEDYSSTKISSLIVKKELKNEYDKVHNEINLKKEIFVNALKKLSGLRSEVEKEIRDTFGNDNLYQSLEKLQSKILKIKYSPINIKYKEIFNQKVIDFLENKDFKDRLKEYIAKFNELIDASDYFERGGFNHNNAFNISKNLKDQGFFKAKHTVSLNSKSSKKEIASETELNKVIHEEKRKIFSDNELSKKFELIDSAITKNQELRNFREYLESNQEIIPELIDLPSFKEKVWLSYFKKEEEKFNDLLNKYKSGKKEIEKIVKQAQEEKTEWLKVINIFNKRFFVPFKLKIINQEDVILKNEVPTIGFIFKDQENEMETDRERLLQVLSSGEKRALYILNIIFEVEARKKMSQETIFIIDDITDSFDYKNKYAIIEYLSDIAKEEIFYEIILTHNFDFFRTVESRFVSYNNCKMAKKTDSGIELINSKGIRNIFNNDWKKNMGEDNKKMIASIPFVRNLIAYTKNEEEKNYLKLTSVLHKKPDSNTIKIKEIQSIFRKELHNSNLQLKNPENKIINLIFTLADECITNEECPNLENKIILSIAIRLKAESFMISKIKSAKKEISAIKDNQTGKLFGLYQNSFPNDPAIKILEQVNLMTPENIHLNSFMYEPLLDLSEKHLIELYKNVKEKLN